MTGHWLSTTRKLNKHYQSGGGTSTEVKDSWDDVESLLAGASDGTGYYTFPLAWKIEGTDDYGLFTESDWSDLVEKTEVYKNSEGSSAIYVTYYGERKMVPSNYFNFYVVDDEVERTSDEKVVDANNNVVDYSQAITDSAGNSSGLAGLLYSEVYATFALLKFKPFIFRYYTVESGETSDLTNPEGATVSDDLVPNVYEYLTASSPGYNDVLAVSDFYANLTETLASSTLSHEKGIELLYSQNRATTINTFIAGWGYNYFPANEDDDQAIGCGRVFNIPSTSTSARRKRLLTHFSYDGTGDAGMVGYSSANSYQKEDNADTLFDNTYITQNYPTARLRFFESSDVYDTWNEGLAGIEKDGVIGVGGVWWNPCGIFISREPVVKEWGETVEDS